MLKEKVQEFIDDLFNGWIDLACDDLDELESYDLVEGDEKDYARARLQEVADDVEYFVDEELQWYTDDIEILNADKTDLVNVIKEVLTELHYDVK